MNKEKSCGIIVFDNNKVLLIKHKLGHIGFPKGHVEKDETEEETALREVKEETNIKAKITPGFREKITYSPKPNIVKDVIFFIGTPLTHNIIPQPEEVQESFFLDYKEAVNLITYDNEKELFLKALKYKNLI